MNAPREDISCQHRWWHAPGVTRHLVCVACGMGQHDVEVRAVPHECVDPAHAADVTQHVRLLGDIRCPALYSALGLVCERPAGHEGDHVDGTYDAPNTLAWKGSLADVPPVCGATRISPMGPDNDLACTLNAGHRGVSHGATSPSYGWLTWSGDDRQYPISARTAARPVADR